MELQRNIKSNKNGNFYKWINVAIWKINVMAERTNVFKKDAIVEQNQKIFFLRTDSFHGGNLLILFNIFLSNNK